MTPLTTVTALRLGKYFGASAAFWMNMRGNFESECYGPAPLYQHNCFARFHGGRFSVQSFSNKSKSSYFHAQTIDNSGLCAVELIFRN
jgi:hypothetical protein